jgi:hypothetical protein
MATWKGHNGALVLGGNIDGVPLVSGAVASAAGSMTVDGSVLSGVLVAGDVFEVDGDGISRTVQTTLIAVSTLSVTFVFTPSATAGFANNATVTFTANSVAELTAWTCDLGEAEYTEDTVKGDTSKSFKLGMPALWTGTGTAYLDKDDTEQGELIDMIATASPDGTIANLIFVVDESGALGTVKQIYGPAVLEGFSTSSPEGASMVPANFNFRAGTSGLTVDWNT